MADHDSPNYRIDSDAVENSQLGIIPPPENPQSSTVEPDTIKLTTSATLPPNASDGMTTATKGNSTFTKIVDSIKQMPTILFASYVFAVIGVIGWFTPLKAAGVLAALVGIGTGIVSLIKHRKDTRYKRNSIIVTIVCVVALFGCAEERYHVTILDTGRIHPRQLHVLDRYQFLERNIFLAVARPEASASTAGSPVQAWRSQQTSDNFGKPGRGRIHESRPHPGNFHRERSRIG